MQTFLTALLLAILCNLQHVALADESEEAHEQAVEEVHETDPEEYHKQMEEISKNAVAEHGEIEEPPLGEETSDDVIPAPPPDPNDKGAGEDPDDDPEPEPKYEDDSNAEPEAGMADVVADDEEIKLPTEYPVIDSSDSHVSDVNEEDENGLSFTIGYSFFEGADAYEVCNNCDVDKEGKRVGTTGEIKKFTEATGLCEVGPACWNTLALAAGQHSFSMRAHTAAKGWSKWSPNTVFDLQAIIGAAHQEL